MHTARKELKINTDGIYAKKIIYLCNCSYINNYIEIEDWIDYMLHHIKSTLNDKYKINCISYKPG